MNVSMWDILKAADEPQVRSRQNRSCRPATDMELHALGASIGPCQLGTMRSCQSRLKRIKGVLRTHQFHVACGETIRKQASDCAS